MHFHPALCLSRQWIENKREYFVFIYLLFGEAITTLEFCLCFSLSVSLSLLLSLSLSLSLSCVWVYMGEEMGTGSAAGWQLSVGLMLRRCHFQRLKCPHFTGQQLSLNQRHGRRPFYMPSVQSMCDECISHQGGKLAKIILLSCTLPPATFFNVLHGSPNSAQACSTPCFKDP